MWFTMGVGVGVASVTWGRRRMRRLAHEVVPVPLGTDPAEVARRLAEALRVGRSEMRRAERVLRSSWGLDRPIEVQVRDRGR